MESRFIITLAVEDKKDFTKKVQEQLRQVCISLSSLEAYNAFERLETTCHILGLVRPFGFEMVRVRPYMYSLWFKDKNYWVDTLTLKVEDRGL